MFSLVPAGRHASSTRADRTRVLANLLKIVSALLAASIAAALAHAAIDLAGDFVLARDAYDGVAHASRSVVAILALALLLALATGTLWAAFRERCEGSTQRSMLDALFARPSRRFVAGIVVGTFLALFAMEALDTLVASGRIGDLCDLLGGSVMLGVGVTLPIALVTAIAIQALLCALLGTSRTLLTITESFLRRSFSGSSCNRTNRAGRDVVRSNFHLSLISRHAGRRAPPRIARAFLVA